MATRRLDPEPDLSNTSVCSSSPPANRINPIELSYGEMSMDASGGIMTREAKMALRKQYGYCIKCPLVPVKLVDIRKSRMNPLWTTRKYISADGESLSGKCLKCFPALDKKRKKKSIIVLPPSFQSSASAGSFASTSSSCSSLTAATTDLAPVADRHGDTLSTTSQNKDAAFYGNRSSIGGVPPSRQKSRSRQQRPGIDEPPRNTAALCRHPPYITKSDFCLTTHAAGLQTDPKISTMEETTAPKSDSFLRDHVGHKTIEIQNHIDDVRMILSSLDGLGSTKLISECLVSCMNLYRSHLEVQLLCLTTIPDIFSAESSNSHQFLEAKGVVSVLDAMETFPGSLEIQSQGCCIIALLGAQPRNRLNLVRDGACQAIKNALSLHVSNSCVVFHCFAAFRIFSTEAEACTILESYSIESFVVEAMQCHMKALLSATIQNDGCAILSNLAVDASTSSVANVSQEVIRIVIQAMQHHEREESLLASACFCLKNLAYNESNLRNMRKAADIMETLEIACRFSSIFSAHDIKEKIQLSAAMDASIEEEAEARLIATLAQQHDDPEIVQEIGNTLETFAWSSRVVATCLKVLRPLVLLSQPHRALFLKEFSLAQIQKLAEDPDNCGVDGDISLLVSLFESSGIACVGL